MNIRLAVESMFPGENVSPIFSSYEAMRANWRGSRPCPTLQEIEAVWEELDAAMYQQKRKDEYVKQGVTIEAMVVALWEKIEEGKTEAYDDLQAKREQVKTSIPKPE